MADGSCCPLRRVVEGSGGYGYDDTRIRLLYKVNRPGYADRKRREPLFPAALYQTPLFHSGGINQLSAIPGQRRQAEGRCPSLTHACRLCPHWLLTTIRRLSRGGEAKRVEVRVTSPACPRTRTARCRCERLHPPRRTGNRCARSKTGGGSAESPRRARFHG